MVKGDTRLVGQKHQCWAMCVSMLCDVRWTMCVSRAKRDLSLAYDIGPESKDFERLTMQETTGGRHEPTVCILFCF